jgi:hypothetical protein
MDIAWEGILMILLIAIILIFIIISLLNFFQPKGSLNYYNSFVSLADGACSSPQLGSNYQFNSPNALVFQLYDNSTCNNILAKYNSTIFQGTYPYSSSMTNDYLLCYATPTSLGTSTIFSQGQYYFSPGGTPQSAPYYLGFAPSNVYVAPTPNAELGAYSLQNELGMQDIQVNASCIDNGCSNFGAYFAYLYGPTGNQKAKTFSDAYSLYAGFYSNLSVSVGIFFSGPQGYCSRGPYNYDLSKNEVLPMAISPCINNFSFVGIQFYGTTVTPTPAAISYQINFSLENTTLAAQALSALSQQCMNLNSSISSGYINYNSVICKPITCSNGGVSFPLTDTANRPFLGLYSGTYTSFGVIAGSGDLQIINPSNENVQSQLFIH